MGLRCLVPVLLAVLFCMEARSDALDEWSARSSPVPVSLQDVIYAQGLFVAIGSDTNSGVPRLIVSTNGVDWIRFASFARFTPLALAYGSNGLFVSIGTTDRYDSAGNPGVIISTNGTNWSFFPAFGDAFNRTNLNSVTYGNGMFVAVGHRVAATSHDGTNWATHPLPAGDNLSTVAFGNGVWAAAAPASSPGGAGPDSGVLMVSTNGTNWAVSDATFNSHHLLFARGRFLAAHGPFPDAPGVVHQGVRLSADGTNWIEITGTTNLFPRRIAHGGGLFFALLSGSGGTNLAAVSLDSTNWTLRTIGGTNRLRAVAYGLDTFVAAGDIILQSADIRPQLRISAAPVGFFPPYRLYLRGLSNAAYALHLSSSLTSWQQHGSPQRATGGEDVFYQFSLGASDAFHRAVHVPD